MVETLAGLTVGMTLADDATTNDGAKLVARENELSLAHLTRIRSFAPHVPRVREPFVVFAP